MEDEYVKMPGRENLMTAIVEKHEPREYSAMIHNGGIVLCDKKEGAFLVLRYSSDLERLKVLLNNITMAETEL